MLVNNKGRANNNESDNFHRLEKNSVSVRLRKKKVDSSRRSRHSGDFSLFKMNEHETEKNKDGDWAYITFPNGVPIVQDIKTNKSSVDSAKNKRQSGDFSDHRRVVPDNCANRNRTEFAPGNRAEFAPVSEHPRQLSVEQQRLYNRRQSIETRNESETNPSVVLRKNSRGVLEGLNSRGVIEGSNSASSSPSSSAKRNNHFRRRSEQPARPTALSGAAKRCSGEFNFISAKSPESQSPGAVDEPRKPTRRPTGLGRRAATQVEIEHKKKNSYNAAMYKSQENLVKACVLSDENWSLEKSCSPSSTIKKGLLWMQRDKLFSRWKERYFVLTKDYLNCFKKGNSKISEMGEFLYKVKICDVDDVELLDKRGYLTICLCLPKDGKVYIRKTEGIRDWHKQLKSCHLASQQRRRSNVDTENFWARKQVTDSSSIENWVQNRKKKGLLSGYSDSTPDINKVTNNSSPDKTQQQQITLTELSALYRNANDEDDVALPPEVAINSVNSGSNANGVEQEKTSPVKVRRNRDPAGARKTKIINRLSLMSDIELPDFGHHQNIDLEKGIFMKKTKGLLDAQSNDSGNHSMSTNASLASSASSKSKESNEEAPEVMHRTVVEVKHRDRSFPDRNRDLSSERKLHRSSYAHGLQITHV